MVKNVGKLGFEILGQTGVPPAMTSGQAPRAIPAKDGYVTGGTPVLPSRSLQSGEE